jgi:penicillin G amidase
VKPVLALAALLSIAAIQSPSAANAPAEFGRIELLRDTWGIPHVFADTDAGAFYGLGYATAQERGFQMTWNLRSIQGRLAEIVGPRPHTARRETAIDHDRKMRSFGWTHAAERTAARLDPETRALLESYSAGVNDSFAAQKQAGTLHPLFDQLGVEPEPWTPAHCLLSWWQLARFFGTDGTRDLIAWRNRDRSPSIQPERTASDAAAIDDAASVVQRNDVSDAWLDEVGVFHAATWTEPAGPASESGAPTFSHAWVVGGGRTTTGSAVLVSDPQTPVRNPSLFMEFHVAGATFNARGVGVPGSPVILIGFNTHVAWGMTALGADQADLFRLETDPDRPDAYRWGDAWRPMHLRKERIGVQGQPDVLVTIRETHLGPIMSDFAFRAPGDPEVALKRVPIADSDAETVQGAIAMIRAKDVPAFNRALAGWRFPSANCVYGDRAGRIGYSVIGAIPIRSVYAPDPNGSMAMPGWLPDHDWRGFVPHRLLPQVLDPAQGLLFSANHRPVGSFYPIPIGLSTGSMGDTIRSWRLRERLAGERPFSPEDVLAVHFDTTNPARRDLVRLGLHLRDTQPHELSDATRLALDRLESWLEQGASSDLNRPGADLATRISTFFRPSVTLLAERHGGGESGLARFLRNAIARIEADPETRLDAEERAFIDRVIADAWTDLSPTDRQASRSRDAAPSRAPQTLGWFDNLDGWGSLDPSGDLPVPAITCLDGQTIQSQAGQAYTQWVPLHDVDSARSLCPIGHSDRPDHPHRASTLSLWAEAALHPAPLSRAAVDRIAVERTVLASGAP